MFAPFVRDMISMAKREHDELVEISDEIQELLPPQLNQTKVTRRAILEILERLVGHNIFGLSMTRDVEPMMSHVNQVTATLKGQTVSVKNALSDTSSFSQNTNKRLKTC